MFTGHRASHAMRWPVVGLFVSVLAVSGSATSADPKLVVFGTSLSDPGNVFALRGGVNVPPAFDLDEYGIPTAQYPHGGHHFTNGFTWVEQLGVAIGSAYSVRAAFRNENAAAMNFAVGGARARADATSVNLSIQVAEFLQRTGGVAPSDAEYVIEMGGNDVRDALQVVGNGGDPAPVLQEALSSIAGHIELLYSRGARKFLVWNVPNIALTPAIRRLDADAPGAAFAAAILTIVFNQGLDFALQQLEDLPGIEIRRLDAYQLLTDIVSDPASFGLSNVTAPCVTANVAPFICDDPDAFTFWDGIHPTVAVHGIVAQEAVGAMGRALVARRRP